MCRIFYCKCCSYSRDFDPEIDSNEIYQNAYNNDIVSFRESINKYTHLDPTLPRVTNIDCPNKECISHTDVEKKEVIYIKYDISYRELISKKLLWWQITNVPN